MSSSNIQRCSLCGSLHFSVPGEPAAKGNSRQVVNLGGRLVPTKSKKHRQLEKSWKANCPVIDPLITDDVEVWFWLTYASRRPDLDESLIMDLMQDRIIKNDRQIKVKHTFWLLDQNDPKAEVFLRPLSSQPCAACVAWLSPNETPS